jgi:hypothetical protein
MIILFSTQSVHPSPPHRQAPSEGRSSMVMLAEKSRGADHRPENV